MDLKFLNIWSILIGFVIGFLASLLAQRTDYKLFRKKPFLELTEDKEGRIDYSGHIDPKRMGLSVSPDEVIVTLDKTQKDTT